MEAYKVGDFCNMNDGSGDFQITKDNIKNSRGGSHLLEMTSTTDSNDMRYHTSFWISFHARELIQKNGKLKLRFEKI